MTNRENPGSPESQKKMYSDEVLAGTLPFPDVTDPEERARLMESSHDRPDINMLNEFYFIGDLLIQPEVELFRQSPGDIGQFRIEAGSRVARTFQESAKIELTPQERGHLLSMASERLLFALDGTIDIDVEVAKLKARLKIEREDERATIQAEKAEKELKRRAIYEPNETEQGE